MWILPFILTLLVIIVLKVLNKIDWKTFGICLLISLVVSFLVITIDRFIQTLDYEIWSGRITDIYHKEEWDEYHPPKNETYKDSNGNTQIRVVPGYWEHHYAENFIKTSDNGSIYVSKSPDGKSFNDSWPNRTEELYQFWSVGDPTASIHSYKNYVQASNSLYKHDGINVKDYTDLPEYPLETRNYIYVDRLIGEFPNKQEAQYKLAEWNSELNKFVDDPANPGKKKSWKEVNLIFVNVGDKPIEYGYALQEKWENGNKNDFIIAMSLKNDGTVNWVYPFSWTEVELLKIQIRDYIYNLKKIDNISIVVDEVSRQIADVFVRKEMVDYEYLQINPSHTSIIIIWVLNIMLNVGLIIYNIYNANQKSMFKRYDLTRNNFY